MNVAIILAGGTGQRIGASCPKQFINVLGKPIIAYTLEAYERFSNIDEILVVCHKDWIGYVEEVAKQYCISKLKWICGGGSTFQESTMNGLFFLQDKISSDDIVLVCFGVAPLVSEDIIDDAIRVCSDHGNAIPSDDVIWCTCIKDDELSSTQNIYRETLKAFNGPWTFRFGDVLEAYNEGRRKNILDNLEPHTTSLYFALGKRIWFSKSSSLNIKITTPTDVDMFEGYLLLQESRK